MRNVLLICPKFFGYEQAIKQVFIRIGYSCDLVDDRPGNGFIVKASLRLRAHILIKYLLFLKKRDISRRLKSKVYDFVILINPEATNLKALLAVIDSSKTKVFAYFWDSVKNKPLICDYNKLADRTFSFDYSDCMNLGMTYLPLFYCDNFLKQNIPSENKNIDISFIGSLHSDRYAIVSKLVEKLKEKNKNMEVYTYFYSPSIFLFIWKKYITREFVAIPWRDVNFVPLPLDITSNLLKRSKYTIDIANKDQTGLTMRTFEAAASNCRIIGNMAISAKKEMPWLDYVGLEELKNFDHQYLSLNSESNLPKNEISAYSIENWVRAILKD